MNINLNADRETIKRWGPLGYLSKEDRDAVLNVSFGQFKKEVKRVERAIKEAKAKRDKRAAY